MHGSHKKKSLFENFRKDSRTLSEFPKNIIAKTILKIWWSGREKVECRDISKRF